MDQERFRQQLNEEIERLRAHAATSTDACTVAKVIAVGDDRVQGLLWEKVSAGNVFRGVRCLAPGSVLFAFDCPPDTICLTPRSFLARVDFATRRVTTIVDPYDPTEAGAAPAPSGAIAKGGPPPGAFAATALGADGARQIAVTITNVTDRSINVDGHDAAFGPFSETVQVNVAPGSHRLDWAVQAPPGTPFTFTLTGATAPISFSATVSDAKREDGFFHFTVQ